MRTTRLYLDRELSPGPYLLTQTSVANTRVRKSLYENGANRGSVPQEQPHGFYHQNDKLQVAQTSSQV